MRHAIPHPHLPVLIEGNLLGRARDRVEERWQMGGGVTLYTRPVYSLLTRALSAARTPPSCPLTHEQERRVNARTELEQCHCRVGGVDGHARHSSINALTISARSAGGSRQRAHQRCRVVVHRV